MGSSRFFKASKQEIEQHQGVLHLANTQFTKLAAEIAELKEGLPTLATGIEQQVVQQLSVEVEQAQHEQVQLFKTKWQQLATSTASNFSQIITALERRQRD